MAVPATAAASARVITGPRCCLAAILLLAFLPRAWELGELGFITPYYLAGVRSMLTNGHNFFFNAFDPAGVVSLDESRSRNCDTHEPRLGG